MRSNNRSFDFNSSLERIDSVFSTTYDEADDIIGRISVK